MAFGFIYFKHSFSSLPFPLVEQEDEILSLSNHAPGALYPRTTQALTSSPLSAQPGRVVEMSLSANLPSRPHATQKPLSIPNNGSQGGHVTRDKEQGGRRKSDANPPRRGLARNK